MSRNRVFRSPKCWNRTLWDTQKQNKEMTIPLKFRFGMFVLITTGKWRIAYFTHRITIVYFQNTEPGLYVVWLGIKNGVPKSHIQVTKMLKLGVVRIIECVIFERWLEKTCSRRNIPNQFFLKESTVLYFLLRFSIILIFCILLTWKLDFWTSFMLPNQTIWKTVSLFGKFKPDVICRIPNGSFFNGY